MTRNEATGSRKSLGSSSDIALQHANSPTVKETRPSQLGSIHSNSRTSASARSFETAASYVDIDSHEIQETRLSVEAARQITSAAHSLHAAEANQSMHSLVRPAERGRQSYWQTLRDGLMRISGSSRLYLIVMTIAAFAQIVAGVIILILSRHEKPDQPLRVFVILHVVRLFLYYPLFIGHRLWPHRIATGDATFAAWHRRLRRLLQLSTVVIFIIGNNWVLGDKNAQTAAPLLYYTSLVYIILGYVYVCTPVVGFLLLFSALGLLFIFSPQFRMRYRKEKGAGPGQIAQIPLVRYTSNHMPAHTISLSSPPSLHGDRHSTRRQSTDSLGIHPEALQSSASLHEGTSERRQRRHGLSRIQILNPFARIAHRLTRSKRQREAEEEMYRKQLEKPLAGFTPRDPEDCMCAICLCDYEEGDVLRLLACQHHMHQACVDEWLHINQTCPLCKQSIANSKPASKHSDSSSVHGATAASAAQSCIDIPNSLQQPAVPAPIHH
ncbi:hypothetical protein IWW40_002080 [Coemansia sp. RSA 1250]|nr:hypothetical protein IWW40_002080 [Coemansia sp. RSA 1250]